MRSAATRQVVSSEDMSVTRDAWDICIYALLKPSVDHKWCNTLSREVTHSTRVGIWVSRVQSSRAPPKQRIASSPGMILRIRASRSSSASDSPANKLSRSGSVLTVVPCHCVSTVQLSTRPGVPSILTTTSAVTRQALAKAPLSVGGSTCGSVLPSFWTTGGSRPFEGGVT